MTDLSLLTELLNRISRLEVEVAALKAGNNTTTTSTSITPSQASETWKVKVTKKYPIDTSYNKIFDTGLLKNKVSIFDIECYVYGAKAYLKYGDKEKVLGELPVMYCYDTELI